MRTYVFILLSFLIFFACNRGKKISSENLRESLPPTLQTGFNEYVDSTFHFSYVYAGMGSGMGGKFPKFVIQDTTFYYTIEQNSSWGEYTLTPDSLCMGVVRNESIDSIMDIVKSIRDSIVYETNVDVMSGGIHYVRVSKGDDKVEFTLHNATHFKANEIIKIVNTNIPIEYDPLFLWKD